MKQNDFYDDTVCRIANLTLLKIKIQEMTLAQFCTEFKNKNTIILLEGKRNVLENDKKKLIQLGKILSKNLPLATFRSGNADGADFYFSRGVLAVAPDRLQVITPYNNHRQKQNNAYETISLDEINLVNEEVVIYQSKNNKKTKSLIDKYVGGAKDRFSIKAAYIIRDTVKVTGTQSGVAPITFAFFYDDEQNPKKGGTGHTINICEINNVPYLTQDVWMEWVK